MKKILFLVLFILSTFHISSQTTPDWRWVHPRPQGQYINWLKMFSPTVWYAAGNYGSFIKTSDAGATWKTFTGGYHSTLYPGSESYVNFKTAWFFDQNTGLLGPQYSLGIVKTTDGGSTFDTIQISTSVKATTYGFHFIDSQTGYLAASSNFKAQKTTNGGMNWTQVPNLPSTTLYCVYASDTNNIKVGRSSGNILITTNAGQTWTTSNVGTSNTIYDMKFLNNNTGYVCGSSGLFRYTTNGGANWSGVNPGSSSLRRIVVSSSDVYVAGPNDNVYKTTDNGMTWTTIPFTAPNQHSPMYVYGFDKNGSTMLVGGSYGQINKTTNDGANWTNINYFKSLSNLIDVYAESGAGRVIAIGYINNSNESMIYSTNGGVDWNTSSYVPSANLSSIKMLNPNTGYICGRFGIFAKTTNGGASWTNIPNTLTPYFLNGTDFINENTGWVVGGLPGPGGNTKIFKTTNGGLNWTEQTSAYSGPIAVKIDMLDANTGWIAGSNQVQKTTNGGSTWVLQTIPNESYSSVNAIDANNCFVAGTNSKVYSTSDGGANWVSLNFPVNAGSLQAGDWYDVNNGAVGGVYGNIGKTTNRGQTWEIMSTGGYTTKCIKIVHPDTMFSVCGNTTGAQTFKYMKGLTGIGIITWNNELPNEFSLEQNYPNPFNPITTIKFSLPKAGIVTLKVFDITGREVASLINGLEFIPGVISTKLDGSEFASGVYFYSLFVDNVRIDTKKMVLIK